MSGGSITEMVADGKLVEECSPELVAEVFLIAGSAMLVNGVIVEVLVTGVFGGEVPVSIDDINVFEK